jgi:FkbM family methyltransferase
MLLKDYGKLKSRVIAGFGLEPSNDAHAETNGEYSFLDRISSFPEIAAYDAVIDVGANRGEWTAAALERFSARGIKKFFCVEPIPTFANVIQSRFSERADVTLVKCVFSQRAGGTTEIFEVGGGGRLYRDYRGRGADDAAPSKKKVVSHQAPISTGDEFLRDIDARPYLVKIDCDGHDFHVLQGFEQALRKRRPVVQFEYSDFWIGAGSRLRDACRFLEAAGYNTFKVFPDRLQRFRFNTLFETFRYQNIVAAPREFASFDRSTISLKPSASK